MIAASAVREFRELFLTLVARGVGKSDPVALLLSGGVDSLSLGFAARALGYRVHAYTFVVENDETIDRASAATACERFGWAHTVVRVSAAKLVDDFRRLATTYACTRKTQFECTWPFLSLFPTIAEPVVLSGVAADGHYGLSKKAMIHYRRPKAAFDGFRRAYFAAPNPAGVRQLEQLARESQRRLVAPYLDPAVCVFFLRFDWDTLNRPQQKYPVLLAFAEDFRRIGVRRHANLQLVARIPQRFETLLGSELNTRGRRRVLDLCRDYAQGDV